MLLFFMYYEIEPYIKLDFLINIQNANILKIEKIAEMKSSKPFPSLPGNL